MPASLVSVLRSKPVPVLRRTTDTPGTTEPDGSATVPVIVPEPAPCALASWGIATNRASINVQAHIHAFTNLTFLSIATSSVMRLSLTESRGKSVVCSPGVWDLHDKERPSNLSQGERNARRASAPKSPNLV